MRGSYTVSEQLIAGRAVTSQLTEPLRLSRSVAFPAFRSRPAQWCTVGAQVGQMEHPVRAYAALTAWTERRRLPRLASAALRS